MPYQSYDSAGRGISGLFHIARKIIPKENHYKKVAAHHLRNFLLMVAMQDYSCCIIKGASPLQHKDKIPAQGAAH